MKNVICLGVLLVAFPICFGCGESKPPSTDAETEQMYESTDYEKEMMGEMSGEASAPSE